MAKAVDLACKGSMVRGKKSADMTRTLSKHFCCIESMAMCDGSTCGS